ncbi:hypothetical protein J6590_046247 [Homalodisca vitripennis]|nr:hypothetical protein J6590_046247 [Homalodisca vitripennis]
MCCDVVGTVVIARYLNKQHQAWLLLGWVTAERYCPCKQFFSPGIVQEITLKLPDSPRPVKVPDSNINNS